MSLSRRAVDVVLTVAGLVLLVLIVLRLQMAGEETLSGAVRIVDGDTLAFGEQSVRLAGIDAPERLQTCLRDETSWPCGLYALRQLRVFAEAGPVTCVTRGRDRHDRFLGVCRSAGHDLNSAMVASGFAVAFGRYGSEEASARREKLGLWAGTFDLPKDWRARHGSGFAPASADSGAIGFLRGLFLSGYDERAVNGDR